LFSCSLLLFSRPFLQCSYWHTAYPTIVHAVALLHQHPHRTRLSVPERLQPGVLEAHR
jgi:hypothetical protein